MLFPGEEVCGFLKWDAWPTTREDYDLHLVRDAIGALETISADDQQNGPLTPTEAICFTNPYNTQESFSFMIHRWSATTSPRFDFFVTIGDALQFMNAAGSVVEPATSPSAFAVGAVAWWDNLLEPYSSVGPTIDGRIKPDIAAPSSVSSGTYGIFAGTSSAAPHVAGAAALVRGMFPLATPGELQAFLEEEALDLGAAGMDSLFGAGVLLLPASQPLVTTFAPTAEPDGHRQPRRLRLALAARNVDELPLGVRHHHGLRLTNRAGGTRIAPRGPGGGIDAHRPDAGHGLPLPVRRHERLRYHRRRRPDEPHGSSCRATSDHVVGGGRRLLAGPARRTCDAERHRVDRLVRVGDDDRVRKRDVRPECRAPSAKPRSWRNSPACSQPPSTTTG